jgi:hypothetical protein
MATELEQEVVEKIPEPPADYLDNDERFKDIIEEASLNYLRSSDTKFFQKNFSGELTPEGYLKDIHGKDSQLKPSQNIGGGWATVEKMARDEFSERHRADNEIYEQREKTRIYENAEQDPVYKQAQAAILEKVNNDSQIRNNNSSRMPEPGMDLWNRVSTRENIHGWSRFASVYPEKAAAYAQQNTFIERGLALREKEKEREKQASERQTVEKVERSKQKDETRRQEILKSLNEVKTEEVIESRNGKSVLKGEEVVYKNPWADEPKLKELEENIKTETQKRLAADPTIHENFAQHYAAIAKEIRDEQWHAFVEKYPKKAEGYQEHYKEIRDALEKKDKVTYTEQTEAEEEVEVKPKVSFEVPPKEDMISDYLSYQDMEVPADEKKSMLDWSINSESANKYAEALQDMLAHTSKNQIEGLASHMVFDAKEILKKIGLRGSAFAESKTWAMWDIAKQYHYATHPDEADAKYSNVDPLRSPKKIQEIVDRHVGWEAYRAKDKKFARKFKKHPLFKTLNEYLNKKPKENGDLSSKDLAELGALLRKVSEKKK